MGAGVVFSRLVLNPVLRRIDPRRRAMRVLLAWGPSPLELTFNGQVGGLRDGEALVLTLVGRRVGSSSLELSGAGRVGERPCQACGLVAPGASGPELTLQLELEGGRVSGRFAWQELPPVPLPAGACFSGPVSWRGKSADMTLCLDYRAALRNWTS